MVLLSVEQDVRAGGGYHFAVDFGVSKTTAFFGRYI
jgi:hypothetical protein